MALVSCAFVGEALTNWLGTASAEQKLALCAALNCGPTNEQIAAVFLDCESQAHVPGASMPTCQQMNDAIEEALQGLGFSFEESDTVSITGSGTAADPFKLGVKISPEPGNRVEVREGGVGVFDTAPPELEVQYVSYALGNDTNPGTRAAPLKTIFRAIQRIAVDSPGYGYFKIYVRANETHEVKEGLHGLTNATLAFTYYDDPLYGDASDNCPGYYPFFAANLARPIINFIGYFDAAQGGIMWPVITANTIIMDGVTLTLPIAPPNAPGARAYILQAPTMVSLGGTDVHVKSGYLTRVGSLVMQGVYLVMSPGTTLTDSLYGPSLTGSDFTGGVVYSCQGKPTFTSRPGNVRAVIKPNNIGLPTDAATKTMFGFNADWDIFV